MPTHNTTPDVVGRRVGATLNLGGASKPNRTQPTLVRRTSARAIVPASP